MSTMPRLQDPYEPDSVVIADPGSRRLDPEAERYPGKNKTKRK